MKPLRLAGDFLPIGKLKGEASRVFRELRETHRPVVVTRNGSPAGVILAPDDFDRLQERERFVAAVEEGLEDVEEGRTTSDEELTRRLRSRFGKPAR